MKSLIYVSKLFLENTLARDGSIQVFSSEGNFSHDFLTWPDKFDCKELPSAEHINNILNNKDLDEVEPSQEVLDARR